jgi:hypothetical protein
MPRPRPPEELKARSIRMSDSEYVRFREWGGGERLRRMMGGQPEKYFTVFQRPEYNRADMAFIKRKQGERND